MLSSAVALVATPAIAAFIAIQRNRLRAAERPLTDHERRVLANYFQAADLERVRIVEQNPLPVQNPPLFSATRHLGLEFPDLTQVGGIAFDSVIAASGTLTEGVLFHELVHVAQYRILGVVRFSYLYARGLLSTGRYEAIPLERCAYELEDRFITVSHPFSVDQEIGNWLRDGRF